MPDEGFGVTVVVLDEATDSLFQFFGGAMGAAAKLLFSQCCEPAFHQLSHEAEVGVKWRWKRGRLASQLRINWVLWVP